MKKRLLTFAIASAFAAAAISFARTAHVLVTPPPHSTISATTAEQTALNKFHGKLAGKTDLEHEDGKWEYSVMVQTGSTTREVMVDAQTGQIASVEVVTAKDEAAENAADAAREDGSSNSQGAETQDTESQGTESQGTESQDTWPPKVPHAKITPTEAISIAKHKLGGGTAFSANFEFDDGKWSYGVMVVKGHTISEVTVNPMSGKAEAVEAVSPAGEAQETQSDLTAIAKAGG